MTSDSPAARTFWVDVEDFFGYFAANPRPSGIQRLVFETLSVLPERARQSPEAPRIAFVRHTGDAALLREVPFDSLARLLESSAPVSPKPQPPAQPVAPHPLKRLRLALIRGIQRCPAGIADPLLRAGVMQLDALRCGARLLARLARRPSPPAPAPQAAPQVPRFAGRPGDVFLVLGAPWVHPDYAALLRRLRLEYRLEPVVLMYDLIPLRRPEWCTAELVSSFTTWLETTLPQCARVLAISQASAADVAAYAREIGHPLPGGVTPLPIGTGFGRPPAGTPAQAPRPRGLPQPDSYVLFVSTLEARKNHALLFRIWRRLLSDLPREAVPTLIFAGRVGWLCADLMQQLENTSWLDGKIRLLRDPTDAELTALYEGCRFTLFPSLFEGWGLPVSESLARGRPCLASHCTSLPEAGGDLARYFDPDDLDDAYRAVRAIIDDPAGLAAWRERVAREFRPVPWERTADAILHACATPAMPRADAALLERVA